MPVRRMVLLAAAMLAWPLAATATLASPAASPPPLGGLVLVELFTSEGCSSCPPADAVLRDLARRPGILALSFHVTYWNRLGWNDPYSLASATSRQRDYAARPGGGDVYTPEMIVDGGPGLVGSDRAQVSRAIAEAPALGVPIGLRREGKDLMITLPLGTPRMLERSFGQKQGQVLLIGFDGEHRTHVGRGENGGLDLREANIVRSIAAAGRWDGAKLLLRRKMPKGEQAAVLLQGDDGRILGARRLALETPTP